jgi:apolipoprotein N-acyltransferase
LKSFAHLQKNSSRTKQRKEKVWVQIIIWFFIDYLKGFLFLGWWLYTKDWANSQGKRKGIKTS